MNAVATCVHCRLQDGEEVLEEGSEVEVSRRGSNTTAHLTLHRVSLTAAGLYTCTAAGLSSSNITLHVIDGKITTGPTDRQDFLAKHHKRI